MMLIKECGEKDLSSSPIEEFSFFFFCCRQEEKGGLAIYIWREKSPRFSQLMSEDTAACLS